MSSPISRPAGAGGRINLFGLDRDGLAARLAGLSPGDTGRARRDRGPAPRRFHADQVFHWMYGRLERDFGSMTDLPLALRGAIDGDCRITWPEIAGWRDSSDGSRKYVLRLEDGGEIEAVHIVHGSRATLCLSSQIGCALQCRFCLTGSMGLVRNLTPGEIVGQVAVLAREHGLTPNGYRVVFMGMGEPLHNYDAVLAAFRILVDADGFALAPRRVTLSTAGLVPGIERLAAESPRPRLAISLAAADDRLRSDLMPVNRSFDLERLMAACRKFPLAPREKVTFEYPLIDTVNDRPEDAARLARLLRGLRAKVNVIPYNEAGVAEFRTPSEERAGRFRDALKTRGVGATIRWSKGRDIGAACGQLVRGGAEGRIHGGQETTRRPD
jgi:23S rRNA (adenine2503-C2)-methyltransferase